MHFFYRGQIIFYYIQESKHRSLCPHQNNVPIKPVNANKMESVRERIISVQLARIHDSIQGREDFLQGKKINYLKATHIRENTNWEGLLNSWTISLNKTEIMERLHRKTRKEKLILSQNWILIPPSELIYPTMRLASRKGKR